MESDSIKFQELQTPCFILDEDKLETNIKDFHRVLSEYFDDSIIGYSFKTNSVPRVLQIVKNLGCFAEVVSDDEFKLAKKIGFQPDKIIFNGPVKDKDTFFEALNNGTLINIDSNREIEWLKDNTDKVDVGIRVNFDLERQLPGQTSTGEYGGRFGFCYENGELHKAIKTLLDNGDNIKRLHMHVSNASKSVEVYRCLAEMACKIISEEKLNVSQIDFGGGYFGGDDGGKKYEDYVSAIYDVLKNHNQEQCVIIVEPGASVIATCFSYRTRVVDVKDTTYGRFVITDGTRLHIDPFMVRERYNYSTSRGNDTSKIRQCICGYSCMEKDRMMYVDESEFQLGDTIEYQIVGSYTVSFNPLFILYLPRIYSKIQDDYVVIRDKWDVDEYIQKSRWEF